MRVRDDGVRTRHEVRTVNLKDIAESDANFCRVFEMPVRYPSGFCFRGGQVVPFIMVDWFNPIPRSAFASDLPETWEACESMLRDFVAQKQYVKPGRTYLVVTDFGEAFTLAVPTK